MLVGQNRRHFFLISHSMRAKWSKLIFFLNYMFITIFFVFSFLYSKKEISCLFVLLMGEYSYARLGLTVLWSASIVQRKSLPSMVPYALGWQNLFGSAKNLDRFKFDNPTPQSVNHDGGIWFWSVAVLLLARHFEYSVDYLLLKCN